MTDAAYYSAVAGALSGVATRAGAVIRNWRLGFAPDQTQATWALRQALARHQAGRRVTVLSRAMLRPVLQRSAQQAAIARRRMGALVARKSGLLAGNGVDRNTANSMPAPMVGAALNSRAIGGRALVARMPAAYWTFGQSGAQRSGAPAARVDGGRSVAAIGTGRLAPHLARSASLGRATSPALPGSSAKARFRTIASSPQHDAAPGFHRTVRPAHSPAAAGDVYLDKSLVGYHLAAAITAEQTRAAGRPSISGAAFNSSMAVLRPAGAGS